MGKKPICFVLSEEKGNSSMKSIKMIVAAIAVGFLLSVAGCPNDSGNDGGTHTHSQGDPGHSHDEHEPGELGETAHDHDSGEAHAEEGEGAGMLIGVNDTYDEVHHGARLVLNYDAQSGSFRGTVENITEQTLEKVRVEVLLSNGKGLGPTLATDLAPGQKMPVQLMATGQRFTMWNAHPEVGDAEHSHDHGEPGHVHE